MSVKMRLILFFSVLKFKPKDSVLTIVSTLRKHSVPLVLMILLIAGLTIASTLHTYRPEVVSAMEVAKRKATLLAENDKLRFEIDTLIAQATLATLKRTEPHEPPPATRSMAVAVGEAGDACVPDSDDWLRSWQRGGTPSGRGAPARAVSTP